MTKRLCHVLTIVFVMSMVPLGHAEEFTLKNYTFVADVFKEGRVSIRVKKDPGGLNLFVASTGGALATTDIDPARAKAVGDVLLKAEEYYEQHQQYYQQRKNTNKPLYNKELTEIVKVEGYQVIFDSTPRGERFSVKVGRAAAFKPMALMNKEEAMKIGKHLQKGEELAAFINRHVTF